ncbi:Sterol uptake control protein [Paramyrothecium foliicola]|nr:Sterol uptake control protein [Paramyrothecium foliicola]
MVFKKVSHRKVRTGCKSCKRRRVKCDETRPGCKNCERHSLECTYLATAPDPRLLDSAVVEFSPFSYSDFKLLHHWNVETAESLAPNSSLQRAMREVIPLLAINHEYLMHALLAVASLHKAYLRPIEAEKYELQATHHQNLALPLYRTALACVTEVNCHALYACGHLVTKSAFASRHLRRNLVSSSSTENAPEFIYLLRGSFSIHDCAYEWLSRGPLGFCLEKPLDPNPNFDLYPDDPHLARLLSVILTEDNEDIHVCCSALNSLRKLLAMVSTPNQTITTKTLTFSWPMQVPERYLVLIHEKKPEALLVLAHYCVLLKMVDSFWFMKGCAIEIFKQCLQNLEPEWHRYIEWPRSVVGLE